MTDTMLVSDIHLGSDISRVKILIPKIEDRLKNGTIKRLVLLGDIFQDINFTRLKKHHWNFLSLLRKYSDEIEIVWVYGNHDFQLVDVMSHLVGLKVYEKFIWTENDKTYCAIHGHQFDKSLSNFFKIKNHIIEIYLKIQKVKILNSIICRFVQYSENNSKKLKYDVRNGAIKFAKQENCNYIFCGHTHYMEHHIEDNIEYYNTGCWVNNTGTIIIQNDKISVNQFDTKLDIA